MTGAAGPMNLTFPSTSPGPRPLSIHLKFYIYFAEIAVPLRVILIPVFHTWLRAPTSPCSVLSVETWGSQHHLASDIGSPSFHISRNFKSFSSIVWNFLFSIKRTSLTFRQQMFDQSHSSDYLNSSTFPRISTAFQMNAIQMKLNFTCVLVGILHLGWLTMVTISFCCCFVIVIFSYSH